MVNSQIERLKADLKSIENFEMKLKKNNQSNEILQTVIYKRKLIESELQKTA